MKKMSWQIGLFRGASSSTSDNPKANGDYALTSRISGLAIKNDNTLLHLGVAYSYRKPQEDKSFGYFIKVPNFAYDNRKPPSTPSLFSVKILNPLAFPSKSFKSCHCFAVS